MSLITQKATLAAAGAGGSVDYWAMQISKSTPNQYEETDPSTVFLSHDRETLFVGTSDDNSNKFHLYSISTADGSIQNLDISVNSSGGSLTSQGRQYNGFPENNKVAAYFNLGNQSLPEQEAYYDYSSGVSSSPSKSGVEMTFPPSSSYSSGNYSGVMYNRYYNSGSEFAVWNMSGVTTPYFAKRLAINTTRVGTAYVGNSGRYYTFGNYRDFQYEPCIYTFLANGSTSYSARFYQNGLNNSPYDGGMVEDSTGTHLYLGLARYDSGYGKTYIGCHKLNETDGSQDAKFTGKTIGGSSDDYQTQYGMDISADDSEIAISFVGKDEYLEAKRFPMPGFITFDESDFTQTKTMQYIARTNVVNNGPNQPGVSRARCFYVADGSLLIVWTMRVESPAYQTYIMITKVDPQGSLDGSTFSFTTSGSYGETRSYEIKNANQTYAVGDRGSSNTEMTTYSNLNLSGRISNNQMSTGSGATLNTTLRDL